MTTTRICLGQDHRASHGMTPASLLPCSWFPRTLYFLLGSVPAAAISLAGLPCAPTEGHYCP